MNEPEWLEEEVLAIHEALAGLAWGGEDVGDLGLLHSA